MVMQFALWYVQIRLSGRSMIMVDETGFNLSMRDTRGRSKIVVRAHNRVPAIRSRQLNVMVGMHSRGMTHFEILEGNSNV